MISTETAGKILNIAEKTRVMIITNSPQEAWDIKWDLQNCALEVDRGTEITSSGVAVKGFKSIIVTDCGSVSRDKITVTGVVCVTDKSIVGRLQSYLGNPVKARLVPIEGRENI